MPPMMPPPMGGMGPKPQGSPAGIGPAGAPGGMAGNQMAGLGKLQAGLKMLMESLPQLQIGSELSNAVMDAVSKIGKHVPEAGGVGGDPSNLMQQLAGMARETKVAPPQAAALQGMMGGGGPPTPGGAPPPQMGA